MAQFNSPVFGKISGKHGTAVAAVRKDGTCILKVYRVASNPNTQGQKNQRGKFGFVMKELNCFRKLFTLTFGGQYGINKAVSLAMKNAVKGEFPDFEMDYSQVRISEKEMLQNFTLDKHTSNPALINLTWTPALFPAEHLNDVVSLVFFNPHSKQLFVAETIGLVSKGFAQVEIPNALSECSLHCWVYTTTSNYAAIQSTYAGIVKFSDTIHL
jgi:hypothetical protein